MSRTTSSPVSPRTSTSGVATAIAAGFALSLVVIVLGNTRVQKGENGGLGPAVVTALVCAVLAGLLYWLVRGRLQGSATATLVLGILAVVTLAAFWSGLPEVLAGAAWAASSGPGERPRSALVGLALATVAAVVALVVTAAEWLS